MTLFLIFLLASVAAASTGVIFKPGPWYDRLKKPSFTPPKWAFPVAWTLIYLLSAAAAARVAVLPGVGVALALWAAQIALNTLWTPLFFGARQMAGGLVVIVTLLVTVASMTAAFWQVDGGAGAMLLPYVAWLVVATALNWCIWRDNPGAADS